MAQPRNSPVKHVLLQKENISTHDKTWLPARLLGPNRDRLTHGAYKDPVQISYAVYLAEYAEYLNALQYFKREHLALTRRKDPKQVSAFTVEGLPGLYFSKSALNSMINPANHDPEGVSYGFDFSTKQPFAKVSSEIEDEYGRPRRQTEKVELLTAMAAKAPEELAQPSSPPETSAAAVLKTKARAARKRAANKRRKARKAVRAARSDAAVNKAIAEKVKAEMTAARLQKKKAAKPSTPPKPKDPDTKVPKKKESPSRRRRREKRAALRQATE